jgi:hypothetical protein
VLTVPFQDLQEPQAPQEPLALLEQLVPLAQLVLPVLLAQMVDLLTITITRLIHQQQQEILVAAI